MKTVKVKFTQDVSNARGKYKAGDEVELSEKDSRDFVRAGLATDPSGKTEKAIEAAAVEKKASARAEKLAKRKAPAKAAEPAKEE